MLFAPRTGSSPSLVGGLSQTGAATFAGVLVAYLLSVPMENVHRAVSQRSLRVDNEDSKHYFAKI
jgi:hypothetical protein